MEELRVFEQFERNGCLLLPETVQTFGDIPWSDHPAYEGVRLKPLVQAEQTGGVFSYHLVSIAPGKCIGSHAHEGQLETHEVIAGSGICVNQGVELKYEPGVISVFPKKAPHEVAAGPDGLYLFAKFIPALS